MRLVLRIDVRRQLVGVGRLQLGEAAVFEDEPRQLVFLGELLEHVLGSRRLALLGLAVHGQLESLVQHLLQLLRRAQVERPARGGVRRFLGRRHFHGELLALVAQQTRIDHDAGVLHLLEHAHERPFDVGVDAGELGNG